MSYLVFLVWSGICGRLWSSVKLGEHFWMPDCHKKPREMSYYACLLSPSNEVTSKILLLMFILRYPWLVGHPCTESLEDMQDIVELTGTYNSHVYKKQSVLLILGLHNIFSLPWIVNQCGSPATLWYPPIISPTGGREIASSETNKHQDVFHDQISFLAYKNSVICQYFRAFQLHFPKGQTMQSQDLLADPGGSTR